MPTAEALEAAIERAIRFLAGSLEPHALVWLTLLHRRFGIDAFADSLQRFDRLLADGPEQAAQLRVFRRIADPANIVQYDDLAAVTHPSDQMIVSALYCDQLDLPPFFPEELERAVASGGYYCTHALLAWIWLEEFGRQIAVPARFVERLFAANAAIANGTPGAVTDLKLEAAAFLFLAGQGTRVDSAFIETVIRTQNDDGGWGMTRARPDASDWHGSVLGLLLLLHLRSSN